MILSGIVPGTSSYIAHSALESSSVYTKYTNIPGDKQTHWIEYEHILLKIPSCTVKNNKKWNVHAYSQVARYFLGGYWKRNPRCWYSILRFMAQPFLFAIFPAYFVTLCGHWYVLYIFATSQRCYTLFLYRLFLYTPIFQSRYKVTCRNQIMFL